jgi:hypothetical protein
MIVCIWHWKFQIHTHKIVYVIVLRLLKQKLQHKQKWKLIIFYGIFMINDKFIYLNQYGEVSIYFASLNMLQMGMFLL